MLKHSRLALLLCLLVVGLICVAPLFPEMNARAQSGTKNGEWRNYGGDLGSTRYAPLDQINAEISASWK